MNFVRVRRARASAGRGWTRGWQHGFEEAYSRALYNLQRPGAADRVAATWYAQSFTVDVNLTDGQSHRVSLQFLDWDRIGRGERVDVLDGATGVLLDSRHVAALGNGTYLSWDVARHVTFRVTRVAGVNAVLSGVFFD